MNFIQYNNQYFNTINPIQQIKVNNEFNIKYNQNNFQFNFNKSDNKLDQDELNMEYEELNELSKKINKSNVECFNSNNDIRSEGFNENSFNPSYQINNKNSQYHNIEFVEEIEFYNVVSEFDDLVDEFLSDIDIETSSDSSIDIDLFKKFNCMTIIKF